MKFISTIIVGAIVGALGVYFTLNWQEEKLEFSITEPAKFGSINYQNITLTNKGWNPVLNVKVLISHDGISFENIQSSSSIKKLNDEKNGIAMQMLGNKSDECFSELAKIKGHVSIERFMDLKKDHKVYQDFYIYLDRKFPLRFR